MTEQQKWLKIKSKSHSRKGTTVYLYQSEKFGRQSWNDHGGDQTYLLEWAFQDDFNKMQRDWLKLADQDQNEIREYFNLFCDRVGDCMFDDEDPEMIIKLLQSMEEDGTMAFLNKLEECRLVIFMEGRGKSEYSSNSKCNQLLKLVCDIEQQIKPPKVRSSIEF